MIELQFALLPQVLAALLAKLLATLRRAVTETSKHRRHDVTLRFARLPQVLAALLAQLLAAPRRAVTEIYRSYRIASQITSRHYSGTINKGFGLGRQL